MRSAPKAIGPLLADLPPKSWADTLQKTAALRRYASIAKPTLAQARAAAAELGMGERGFYRLVRAYEELGTPRDVRSVRGSPRRADPRVNTHIRQVAAELGRGATVAALLREVSRRCARDGLDAPTLSKLVTRLDDAPAASDLRSVLGTGADLILDVAPIPIPIEAEGATAAFGYFGAVIAAAGGRVLSWRLTQAAFAEIDAQDLVDGVPPADEPRTMVLSQGLAKPSADRCDAWRRKGLLVGPDDGAIRVGAAMRAVFGRHIGRIRILEVAPPPGRTADRGVPLAVAREVVGLLVARRNESLTRTRT